MIRNFEYHTHELTDEEKELLPMFIQGLTLRVGNENAVKNKEIRAAFENKKEIVIPDGRVRKIINHIRINGLVKNLAATSKGYFISETKAEAEDYLASLGERIGAQMKVYDSLSEQMKSKDWGDGK